MPTAANSKLQYEAGQQAYPMSALTNSGDATTYTSSASRFSSRTGYAPVIRPDGLRSGGVVIPAVSGTNNLIDVSALTAFILGVEETNAAETDVTITRAATDVAKICSVTYDQGDGSITIVQGTDSASSAFSETRAAAGGPPLIPVDAVEIAQIRMTSNTAAAILTTEIFAVPGLHLERFDYPAYDVVQLTAKVVFVSALPSIHTGPLPKTVYASYADPIFADITKASDYQPSENSHTVNSTQIYGSTLGSVSSTLGQGSFTLYTDDGATDALVTLKDETLWFRFYPDRYKDPFILDQGKLGITRSYPAGDSMSAACTISAESAAEEYAS